MFEKPVHAIHFVGIKGVGMTPLALIANEAGFTVSGSDVEETYITDEMLQKAGIVPFIGFAKEHIQRADFVITTGAHGGYSNVEVQEAKARGIPVMTQGEAVGYFMSGKPFGRKDVVGISVAGCHGKTTTTAMIATLLRDGGFDPSFVIGTGTIPSLGTSGYYGKGVYFVAEADEYATEPTFDKTAKLLWQHPKYTIITNIEFDHPDLYKSIAEVRNTYKTFIDQLPVDSTLVVCGDDENIKMILSGYTKKYIRYGFHSDNDYILQRVVPQGNAIQFSFFSHKDKQTLSVGVPGEHNGLNALGAYIVAKEIGIPFPVMQKSFRHFAGTKRRLEFIGKLFSGAAMYDDYAHHPTEIKKSLDALRSSYPDKKIVCIFQPHTFSRTKLLFEDFSSSFKLADEVIITSIYASQREVFDTTISSNMLVDAVKKVSGTHAVLRETLGDVIQYVKQKAYDDQYIIITMGAGDVYTILPALLT
ncbi:MAG TPA: UDP-N-acetylmuramate--L-alanine ligase [Patescibacteria group bacterium]|nr:UDP-N-acetylmuramate--L-alanine ligase [Patescibacteria group bacterium]